MSKNVNIRNLTGEHGGKTLGAGDSVTGVEYGVIICVTDVILNSIASNVDQSAETIGTGLTFPAGFHIYGVTTAVSVNTGTVMCFNRS